MVSESSFGLILFVREWRYSNVLVFKSVNELIHHPFCQWSIRFTDAQGNPVKGIQVTLTP
jgi:hypothetical protein